MLRIEGLSKRYKNFALHQVDFEVKAGQYFVMLGQSGSGKTLILEMICGLLVPDAGRVWLEGRDVTDRSIQSRPMGLVYQDHALFPHMSVYKNIAYALPKPKDHARVMALARQVGAEALLKHKPATLSLGEAQRVALARALARQPKLLLLDEPLASLDIGSKAQIRALLRQLNNEGQTIIHVTHDYAEALALADRVAVLEEGTLSQVGTPDEVFHHPQSRFVANFVGIRNYFRGQFIPGDGYCGTFTIDDLEFSVASDAAAGPSSLMLKSEDLTVSLERPSGSARNAFQGVIEDMEPAHRGVELTINIGRPVYALVTSNSIQELSLNQGTTVWVSFKATAATLIQDQRVC